jgi:hypothetical protein
MMVALGALALSPSGYALSVDAWFRRRRARRNGEWPAQWSDFAGWPIKLIQWFFVLMYISAVWSKLSASGLDWANGFTLQYYLARDGLRWDSLLGYWMSHYHTLILMGPVCRVTVPRKLCAGCRLPQASLGLRTRRSSSAHRHLSHPQGAVLSMDRALCRLHSVDGSAAARANTVGNPLGWPVGARRQSRLGRAEACPGQGWTYFPPGWRGRSVPARRL